MKIPTTISLCALACWLFLLACDVNKGISAPPPPHPTDDFQEATESCTYDQYQSLQYDIKSDTTIVLEKLIYYLDEPLVLNGLSNLTLDGNGCTFFQSNKDADVIRIEGGSNITLMNFKATHEEPSGPIGCTGSVVQVYGGSNHRIENCLLNGSGIIGVVAYEAKDLTVSGNYIYNNSKYGILYDTGTTIEITNNRFADNGDDGKAHVGNALNAYLSEVDLLPSDQSKVGLKMSGNRYE